MFKFDQILTLSCYNFSVHSETCLNRFKRVIFLLNFCFIYLVLNFGFAMYLC